MAEPFVKVVKVKGIPKGNFDFDILVQPEMADARDTIVGRMMRGGKGLGVKRNSLSAQVYPVSARTAPLAATVTTSLNFPRTKGTSWAQYQEKVVKGIVARNAVNKAVQRIQERWAAGSVNGDG